MINKFLLAAALCGLFAPLTSFANDKVATVYHPAAFQKMCQSKAQGERITFAYKGITWNGSCQNQFFSSDSQAQIVGDEPELLNVCRQNPQAKTVTIEGRTYNGQCALGFSPPRPQAGNR